MVKELDEAVKEPEILEDRLKEKSLSDLIILLMNQRDSLKPAPFTSTTIIGHYPDKIKDRKTAEEYQRRREAYDATLTEIDRREKLYFKS
jgi:hypothetical protein